MAPVYFEAASVIIALILLGRMLEARAKGRTGEAIRRLIGLAGARPPASSATAQELDIPVEEVVPGDIVRRAPRREGAGGRRGRRTARRPWTSRC